MTQGQVYTILTDNGIQFAEQLWRWKPTLLAVVIIKAAVVLLAPIAGPLEISDDPH